MFPPLLYFPFQWCSIMVLGLVMGLKKVLIPGWFLVSGMDIFFLPFGFLGLGILLTSDLMDVCMSSSVCLGLVTGLLCNILGNLDAVVEICRLLAGLHAWMLRLDCSLDL